MTMFDTRAIGAINRALEGIRITYRPNVFSSLDDVWFIESFRGGGDMRGIKIHDDCSGSFVLIAAHGEHDAKYLGAHVCQITPADVCELVARLPTASNGPGGAPFASYKKGATYRSIVEAYVQHMREAEGPAPSAQKLLHSVTGSPLNLVVPTRRAVINTDDATFVLMECECTDANGNPSKTSAALRFDTMSHYERCKGSNFGAATAAAFASTLPSGWTLRGPPAPKHFLVETPSATPVLAHDADVAGGHQK